MSTLHTQPGIGEFPIVLKVTRQLVFFISAGSISQHNILSTLPERALISSGTCCNIEPIKIGRHQNFR